MKVVQSAKELLEKLEKEGLFISLNNEDNLEIEMYQDDISPDLIREITDNKKILVNYLKITRVSGKEEQNRLALNEYVVSSAQKSIWILSQSLKTSIAYNIPFSIPLYGTYDIDKLQKAIEIVVDKHEILRTVFNQKKDGEIIQIVLDRTDLLFKVECYDFSQNDIQTEINEFVKKEFSTPFDLERGPLFKVFIVKRKDNSYLLCCNMHHIIGDGWSIEVLKEDVITCYNKLGSLDYAYTLDIQYKDYAFWEYNMLKRGKFEHHKKYWIDKLSGNIPLMTLPTSLVRPRVKTYNSLMLRTRINKEHLLSLKRITSKKKCTLFVGITSLLVLVLQKYAGEKDLILGYPVIDRPQSALKNQIGYYIKTLVLRVFCDKNKLFSDFLVEVQENVLQALEHKDYPFEQLVEDLGQIKDPSRSPIFDISITYHNEVSNSIEDDYNEIEQQIEYLGEGSCKNDIEFHFQETNGYMSFSVNFNKDVYEIEIIESLMNSFKLLFIELESLLDKKIEEINGCFLSNKTQVDLSSNNIEIDFLKNTNVIDIFKETVKVHPNKIALFFNNSELSYRELDILSDHLATVLVKNYQISKGDYIGVQLQRSEWSIISLIAIMKLGGVYVPIDVDLPTERKKYIVEDCGIQIMITQALYILELDFFAGIVFPLDLEINLEDRYRKNYDQVLTNLLANDIAYVIYTSGTSGNTKGVVIEHGGLSNTIQSQIEIFNIVLYENCLFFASISFDASISEIFIAILTGKKLFIVDENTRIDISKLEQYILFNKIDVATLPPTYFNLLNLDKLKNLKVLITAGEAAIPNKVKEYLRYGGVFYNAYGPTEVSICCSVFKVVNQDDLKGKSIPIGYPLKNTNIYIVDEYNRIQKDLLIGEIWVSGVGVAKGYINQTELNNEKFIENHFREKERIYKTGDLGRRLVDGSIEFIGRVDNQVKIRGNRIELEEIENQVLKCKKVKQCVVRILQTDLIDSIVVYYSVFENIEKIEIHSYLKTVLPHYMIPHYYVKMDYISLTINGKIDYTKLPEPNDTNLVLQDYSPPKTQHEIALVNILLEVLKLERISINDNLYDLGVRSIVSIQIVNSLKKLGYIISIQDVLENPKLSDLARVMTFSKELEEYEYNEKNNLEILNIAELSYNQLRFYKLPFLTNLFEFQVNDFSTKEFDKSLINLLEEIPVLRMKIIKTEGKIYQQNVLASEVICDLNIQEVNDDRGFDELMLNNYAHIKRNWEFIDKELIRCYVVVNKFVKKARILIGVPYVLLDLYSKNVLESKILQYFNKEEVFFDFHHPFEFINIQKKYLASGIGQIDREYWVDCLKSSLFCTNNDNICKATRINRPVIIQEYLIKDEEFKKFSLFKNNIKLPFSAILNFFYEIILNELDYSTKKIYGILVDGREADYEGLDILKVIGVVNNMIPIVYNDFVNVNYDLILECYQKYLNARNHQKVPYEVICKDVYKATGNSLDNNIVGYFNFHEFSDMKIEGDLYTKEILKMNESAYELSLVCIVYSNGIILRLVSDYDLYENNVNKIYLPGLFGRFLSLIERDE